MNYDKDGKEKKLVTRDKLIIESCEKVGNRKKGFKFARIFK